MKKTIGILGGMGPEATSTFFQLLVKHTTAKKDQDHIPIIIYNNPKIPPRTDAFEKTGPSPVPYLVKGAHILEKAGVDFIVMPCITIHLFLPEVSKQIHTPFIDLIKETSGWLQSQHTGIKTIGLISSTGTLRSRIFQTALENIGIRVLHPDEKIQEKVMEAIFGDKGIKAGHTEGLSKSSIHTIAKQLIQEGAEAIIAGCTEIPLVLKSDDLKVPLIDPLYVGAKTCIRHAGYTSKP